MKIIYLRSNNPDVKGQIGDARISKTADTLLSCGHEVKFIAWDRSGVQPRKISTRTIAGNSIEVEFLACPRNKNSRLSIYMSTLKFQKLLKKWLIKHSDEYDAVHAHDFDTAYTAVKCTKKTGKQVVYDIGDYYADTHQLPFPIDGIVRRRDTKTINQAFATIICSEERVLQIAPAHPKRLIVVYNAPPHIDVKQGTKLYEANDKFKIVYFGTLATDRLLFETIDVVKTDPSLFLVIGGNGDEDVYRTFREKIGDSENIVFKDYVDTYQDMLYQQSLSDALIVATDNRTKNYKYTAPNKFGEAMMLGKPIIVAKDTSIDKVVEKYDVGVVIEYSEKGLREGIDKLKKMTAEEKSAMRLRAEKVFDEVICWEISAKKIAGIYEQLNTFINGKDL